MSRRIMTAFHQMGLQPEELLAAVEGWANRRLAKLPPQALSLALWSFARMGSGSPKLLETAAACAEQQLGAFTPPQLAKVAWSFAKLRWPVPRVLRHAGAQLAAHTGAFGDKEASNVLWALASEVRGGDGEGQSLQGRLYSQTACCAYCSHCQHASLTAPTIHLLTPGSSSLHACLPACRGRPCRRRRSMPLPPTCSRA
jgi:hypothetical protein